MRGASSALTGAVVRANGPLGEGHGRLELGVPRWEGPEPEPGQFLMLRMGDESQTDPLLSRPFGFAGYSREGLGARVEVLYRVFGRGTRRMAGWTTGRHVRFLGPLGTSFPLPPLKARVLVVAGGIGLPPLLFLARRLREMGREKDVTLLFGGTGKRRLPGLEDAEGLGIEVRTSTEDGSLGARGKVTDLLAAHGPLEGVHLYVCGPNPMMRGVHALASGPSAGRPAASWYSLEARMACGFGVCSGCAVWARGTKGPEYLRACKDGPVFPGEALLPESFGDIAGQTKMPVCE